MRCFPSDGRMKALILPALMALAGLAAGAAAGLYLSPPTPESTDGEPAAEETADPGSELAYADFDNQFVVPVVREGRVRSLVVLSITLELSVGASQEFFDREPRLRDAFLQVLFDHANAGGFDAAFTDVDRMLALRQGLREAAQLHLGRSVRDVLIVDIVRQET